MNTVRLNWRCCKWGWDVFFRGRSGRLSNGWFGDISGMCFVSDHSNKYRFVDGGRRWCRLTR
jgi:hypothetical protein